jgi:hypothetical protein
VTGDPRGGPVVGKWMPLAQRVAKPGAYAIGMHPTGAAGAVPDWNAELPEQLRIELRHTRLVWRVDLGIE